MTSDTPSYFNLLSELLNAAEEEILAADGRDPRQKKFEEVVRSIDHALGGEDVLYCTHSFTNLNGVDAPLTGRAIAFTSSLVATVDLRSRSDVPVIVVPLSSLDSISLDDHRGPQFLGSTPWNERRASLRFGGTRNIQLLLPGAPSSEANTHAFTEFYPTLLNALRSP